MLAAILGNPLACVGPLPRSVRAPHLPVFVQSVRVYERVCVCECCAMPDCHSSGLWLVCVYAWQCTFVCVRASWDSRDRVILITRLRQPEVRMVCCFDGGVAWPNRVFVHRLGARSPSSVLRIRSPTTCACVRVRHTCTKELFVTELVGSKARSQRANATKRHGAKPDTHRNPAN